VCNYIFIIVWNLEGTVGASRSFPSEIMRYVKHVEGDAKRSVAEGDAQVEQLN
jgi:hypothetical protein